MEMKAIFFDLDKTLWTFKEEDGRKKINRAQGQKLIEILRKNGFDVRWDTNFMGSVFGNGIWAAERAEYYSTAIPPRYGDVLRKIVHFWVSPDIELDWNEVYRSLYVDESPLKVVYPDVVPVLTALRDSGIRIGLISNRTMGGRRFVEDIGRSPLSGLFDVMVVSCDVGYMKPHREIFNIAMRDLDVGPESSMMVGDLLRADVIGAQRAGMKAVWINREGQPNDYPSVNPDFEITDLNHLLDIVLR
jgi:HAD superfamily hydrolase (TIGR01509 family)